MRGMAREYAAVRTLSDRAGRELEHRPELQAVGVEWLEPGQGAAPTAIRNPAYGEKNRRRRGLAGGIRSAPSSDLGPSPVGTATAVEELLHGSALDAVPVAYGILDLGMAARSACRSSNSPSRS